MLSQCLCCFWGNPLKKVPLAYPTQRRILLWFSASCGQGAGGPVRRRLGLSSNGFLPRDVETDVALSSHRLVSALSARSPALVCLCLSALLLLTRKVGPDADQ